jgi:hypothetical protein
MFSGVYLVTTQYAMCMMMCLNDGSSPGVTGV